MPIRGLRTRFWGIDGPKKAIAIFAGFCLNLISRGSLNDSIYIFAAASHDVDSGADGEFLFRFLDDAPNPVVFDGHHAEFARLDVEVREDFAVYALEICRLAA